MDTLGRPWIDLSDEAQHDLMKLRWLHGIGMRIKPKPGDSED